MNEEVTEDLAVMLAGVATQKWQNTNQFTIVLPQHEALKEGIWM